MGGLVIGLSQGLNNFNCSTGGASPYLYVGGKPCCYLLFDRPIDKLGVQIFLFVPVVRLCFGAADNRTTTNCSRGNRLLLGMIADYGSDFDFI
jgi:hypothetical protein